jgi:hypothetical protein
MKGLVMLTWLEGRKTYAVALIMILSSEAKGRGWIDPATYEVIMGILVALGFGFLRAGVSKVSQ